LHPKSEIDDQASGEPGRLIIEWTTQLWPSTAGRAQLDEASPLWLGAPQPSSALALLPARKRTTCPAEIGTPDAYLSSSRRPDAGRSSRPDALRRAWYRSAARSSASSRGAA